MKTIIVLFIFFTGLASLHAQPMPGPAIIGTVRLSDSVACGPVEDQALSPTCWVFGTNSLIAADLYKHYGIRVNLSEMYIARYAYIDKANTYLASSGKTYFEGGGQFHDVIRVIENYGMVPEEVYPGLLPGQSRHHHDALDTAMQRFIRPLLAAGKRILDSTDLQQVNDTLDKYLGSVPGTFLFEGKQYSPRSFADEKLQFRNEYAEMVSFADQPLYQSFILRDKYNWADDRFYNITLDDMRMLVDTALQKGYTVGWEGDVTETGFRYIEGVASLPDSLHSYDEERLQNYRDESTERDHMLQVAGSGRDASGRKWYYLKNSWGPWFSKYRGYLYMDENYFRLKTVILFVHKKALPQQLRNKLFGE